MGSVQCEHQEIFKAEFDLSGNRVQHPLIAGHALFPTPEWAVQLRSVVFHVVHKAGSQKK